MELDTIRLRHWHWRRDRVDQVVPVVPDRDSKVFNDDGYVAGRWITKCSTLKSHNQAFSPLRASGSGLFLLKEYLPYVDFDYGVGAYWFHASRVSAEQFYSEHYLRQELHVGTLTTALERRIVLTESQEPRPYIHVFKLRSARSLQKTWVLDRGAPAPYNPQMVSRYVNTYECPGSVSLVGNIKNFELVDTIWMGNTAPLFTFDELLAETKERFLPYV